VTATSEQLTDFTPEQNRLLRDYLAELLEANRKFNLTAVRSESEAWDRHIKESALLVPLLGSPARLLDVGSGGGLPGMVLAICMPQTAVALLEATEKKARFLEATAKKLGLDNVQVIAERAEVAGRSGSPWRESFDLVTARAVAPLRTLLELSVPFLKVDGQLVAVKGQKAQEELDAAQQALSILHAEMIESVSSAAGTCLRLKKNKATPGKYPRRSGEPKHRPL
jgi:16S rRNA (guanine527-N7)-methyltransferase